MSRFIEILEKSGEPAPSRLGFAPAVSRDAAPPQIALVARVLAEDLAKDPGLAEADAAALLVGAEYPIPEAAVQALEDRLWGVRLSPSPSTLTVEQAQALAKQGCDFVIFESMDTEAAVLNDEDMGKIVVLTAETDEETVRALAGLSVDAVLFGPGIRGEPLTVSDLVAVQKVRQNVGRLFLVETPDGLQQADVEAMRNLGVDGLIVNVPPLKRASEVKKAIASLPKRQAQRDRTNALVPGASMKDYDSEDDEGEE